MSAAELITKAERYGAHLGIEDGRVYVDPPAAIPRDLYRELKSHAGELLELLTACQTDPLPPEGDPRRAVFEILDEVWEAGGWLLITGDRVRAAPRDAGAPSDRLTPELLARVDTYQAELLRALTRVPKSVQTERSVPMT